MESLETSTPKHIAIRDADHIANVVDKLGYNTHTLSIKIGDSSVPFPVTVKKVDPLEGWVSLSLVDAQSLEASQVFDQTFALRAVCDTEELRFDELVAMEVLRDDDVLNIQCSLPAALYTTAKRNNARITLLKGMTATVEMTLYENQQPIRGRLRNISTGGALIEVPLSDSSPLKTHEFIAVLVITFPSGEIVNTMALIRHVHPAGRSHYAAIGVAFFNLSKDQEQRLIYIVNETERETAYRTGEGSRMCFPSPLYSSNQPGYKRSARQRKIARKEPPMVPAIREVARQMHVVVLALQNQRPLPQECLADCADTLLHLLRKNRQNLFYAIQCLSRESNWVQHSIIVAVRLGDLMLAEPEYAARAHQGVMAALMHDMGKAMLLGESLTSLEGELNDRKRHLLRQHVNVLLDQLDTEDWLDDSIKQDVIGRINEKLDGSGYPLGLTGQTLSPLARMSSVVDIIEAMTRQRGDRPAKTAIEAYRYLYNRPESFDKHWVTRYIQRHGFYPIGSLVKFTLGFLAWVLELDDSGQPQRILVVRNLKREKLTMNEVLGRVDFSQLGTIEGVVAPEKYNVKPF